MEGRARARAAVAVRALLRHRLVSVQDRAAAQAAAADPRRSVRQGAGTGRAATRAGRLGRRRRRRLEVFRQPLAVLDAGEADGRRHSTAERRRRPAELVRRAARTARDAGLPPRVLAHRRARNQLPPLLRRQHAGRPARRRPGGVRRDPRAARAPGARSARHRHPHRPSGRAVRSGEVLRDAAGAGRADLRRRREDPVGTRAAAARMGGARDHRLQLPQPAQRAVRRAGARAPDAQGLRQADRPRPELRRPALRDEAPDHGHLDGERADRAGAHARSHRREQPALARLHAEQPARRVDRGGGLLPQLPHLRRRTGLGRGRSHLDRAGHRPGAAPQPGDGLDDLRLPARGAAAARSRRHAGQRLRAPRRLPCRRRVGNRGAAAFPR